MTMKSIHQVCKCNITEAYFDQKGHNMNNLYRHSQLSQIHSQYHKYLLFFKEQKKKCRYEVYFPHQIILFSTSNNLYLCKRTSSKSNNEFSITSVQNATLKTRAINRWINKTKCCLVTVMVSFLRRTFNTNLMFGKY